VAAFARVFSGFKTVGAVVIKLVLAEVETPGFPVHFGDVAVVCRFIAGSVAQRHAKVVAAKAVGVVDPGKPIADVVGVVHLLPGAVFVAVQVFVLQDRNWMRV
jgi:hypothetical protein